LTAAGKLEPWKEIDYVVTNDSGSVTSSLVALRPFLPPQNFTAQNLGTGLQLQ
jgi:hypothetical protein